MLDTHSLRNEWMWGRSESERERERGERERDRCIERYIERERVRVV